LRKFHTAKIRACRKFSRDDKKSLRRQEDTESGTSRQQFSTGASDKAYVANLQGNKKNRALTIAGSTLYNPKKPNENNLKLTLISENLQS
jgi:hypothetical protein